MLSLWDCGALLTGVPARALSRRWRAGVRQCLFCFSRCLLPRGRFAHVGGPVPKLLTILPSLSSPYRLAVGDPLCPGIPVLLFPRGHCLGTDIHHELVLPGPGQPPKQMVLHRDLLLQDNLQGMNSCSSSIEDTSLQDGSLSSHRNFATRLSSDFLALGIFYQILSVSCWISWGPRQQIILPSYTEQQFGPEPSPTDPLSSFSFTKNFLEGIFLDGAQKSWWVIGLSSTA